MYLTAAGSTQHSQRSLISQRWCALSGEGVKHAPGQHGHVARNTDTLLAVRAGRLFDGQRSFGPSTVLIEGGRIIDIDTTGATPSARAAVTDLGSAVCLLPGLIDAHVHLAFDASADVVAGLNARRRRTAVDADGAGRAPGAERRDHHRAGSG
jgi:predicted amidohydrolase